MKIFRGFPQGLAVFFLCILSAGQAYSGTYFLGFNHAPCRSTVEERLIKGNPEYQGYLVNEEHTFGITIPGVGALCFAALHKEGDYWQDRFLLWSERTGVYQEFFPPHNCSIKAVAFDDYTGSGIPAIAMLYECLGETAEVHRENEVYFPYFYTEKSLCYRSTPGPLWFKDEKTGKEVESFDNYGKIRKYLKKKFAKLAAGKGKRETVSFTGYALPAGESADIQLIPVDERGMSVGRVVYEPVTDPGFNPDQDIKQLYDIKGKAMDGTSKGDTVFVPVEIVEFQEHEPTGPPAGEKGTESR